MEEDFEDVEVIYSDDEENDLQNLAADLAISDEEIEADVGMAEVPDMSRVSFAGHNKSVFAGQISKDMSMAITGGEDDMAYVWSLVDAKVQMECTGHKDSVTEVAFSHNDEFVATGDMGGVVQVWNIKNKKLVWCYEGEDLDWLNWHPKGAVLFTSHSGSVYVWRIPQGDCKVLEYHSTRAICSKILPNGKQLLVGYDNGQIRLWDVKTSTMVWQLNEPFTSAVIQLDVNAAGTLLLAAPVSQVIKVSDGKPIANLLVGDDTDIEVVLFDSALNLAVTGSLNGNLCIWDAQRYLLRHQKKLNCAITAMKCDGNSKLLVSTVEGVVHIYDLKTTQMLQTLTGHHSAILSLCLSPDRKSILTTSDDTTAKIFEITC